MKCSLLGSVMTYPLRGGRGIRAGSCLQIIQFNVWIQDKTEVLQSSHSRLNWGENISKQVKILCFSCIFNFIALVFFSQTFFISVCDSEWLKPQWVEKVFKADRNKMFASITLMLNMLHSYMSVVRTYHCRGVSPRGFLTQGNLQGGGLEDHRMMFTWHLNLLQSYIKAVLYLITWYL